MGYGSVERAVAAGAAPRPRPARHAVLVFATLGAAAALLLRGGSRAAPSSLDAAPPATAAGAASSAPLTYTVSNEYGELSNHTLSLYGFSHVFEPYKTSSVAIVGDDGAERVRWLIMQADGSLALDAEGRNATLQCTVVGALNVTLLEAAGGSAAGGAWAVRGRDLGAACLYVRRELRTLTRDDLSRFVGALRAVYETPADEGRAKYGADFHTGLALTAKHASRVWTYHFGCQFFTSHPAYQLYLEQALRAVDPSISHPYWDFLEDAGREWQNSTVFADEYFGPVRTRADDDFVVRSGPFAFLPTTWDASGTFLEDSYENMFGIVTYPGNPLRAPYMQRSARFCGRETRQPMPVRAAARALSLAFRMERSAPPASRPLCLSRRAATRRSSACARARRSANGTCASSSTCTRTSTRGWAARGSARAATTLRSVRPTTPRRTPARCSTSSARASATRG